MGQYFLDKLRTVPFYLTNRSGKIVNSDLGHSTSQEVLGDAMYASACSYLAPSCIDELGAVESAVCPLPPGLRKEASLDSRRVSADKSRRSGTYLAPWTRDVHEFASSAATSLFTSREGGTQGGG